MKKTKLKRQSKQKISVIQRKIWDHCKRLIRSKYGNTCYTCKRTGLSGSNWHTGHVFPKASLGAYLKYDLRVLRPQCYNCNINLGGNGAVFIERLREIEGDEYVDNIIRDKAVLTKAYDHYIKILLDYQNIETAPE